NVFFFNITDGRGTCLGVLVVNRKADLDLKRNAVRHSTFLTLLLIVFVLETDRFAAIVTKIRPDSVECTAVVAEYFSGIERIDLDLGTAILTVCPEMFETLEVAALTLPVADLIFNKL